VRAAAAPGLAVGIALAVGLLAGCGGGSDSTASDEAPPGSLEALWRAPGEDAAIVPGSEDFAPGRVRLSFLVVDGRGRVVSRPTARIWLAKGLEQTPFAQTTARLEQIGVHGGHEADAKEIFVTHLDLAKPGKYWLLAEPVGGRKIQAIGNVVVKKEAAAPDIGDRAPAWATTAGWRSGACPPSRTPFSSAPTAGSRSASKGPSPSASSLLRSSGTCSRRAADRRAFFAQRRSLVGSHYFRK